MSVIIDETTYTPPDYKVGEVYHTPYGYHMCAKKTSTTLTFKTLSRTGWIRRIQIAWVILKLRFVKI